MARLAATALVRGAAAPLPASAVLVDERVPLTCRVPLREGRGESPMCPAAVMTAGEARAALAGYQDALVVRVSRPLAKHGADARLGDRGYAEGHSAATWLNSLRESENGLVRLLTGLKREACNVGYRFAAACSGGARVSCEERVSQASRLACGHPFVARPSIKTALAKVIAAARAADLAADVPARQRSFLDGPAARGRRRPRDLSH